MACRSPSTPSRKSRSAAAISCASRMTDESGPPSARRVDPVVWRRIGSLTRGAFGSVRDTYTRVVLGAISGAVLGTVVAFVTAPSTPGLVLAMVAAAGCVLLGGASFIRRELRLAFELVLDLERAGRRFWREEAGTAAPHNRGAARHRIDSHPTEPVPIGMLLLVGRLEEADDAIAALDEVPSDWRLTWSCCVRPGACTAVTTRTSRPPERCGARSHSRGVTWHAASLPCWRHRWRPRAMRIRSRARGGTARGVRRPLVGAPARLRDAVGGFRDRADGPGLAASTRSAVLVAAAYQRSPTV